MVYGYFTAEKDATIAIQDLREAGFCRDQIFVGGRPLSDSLTAPNAAPAPAAAAPTQPENRSQTPNAESRKGADSGNIWQRVRDLFGAGGPKFGEPGQGDLSPRTMKRGPIYIINAHSLRSFASTLFDDRVRTLNARYGRNSTGLLVMVDAGGRREDAEAILEANGADLGTHADPAELPLRKAS